MKKKGLVIVLMFALLTFGAGGRGYVFSAESKTVPGDTPEAIYFNFVQALTNDDTYGALALMTKNIRDKWDLLSDDQRDRQLEHWRANCFADYALADKEVRGNEAILRTTAPNPSEGREVNGEIILRKEDGNWRVFSFSYR